VISSFRLANQSFRDHVKDTWDSSQALGDLVFRALIRIRFDIRDIKDTYRLLCANSNTKLPGFWKRREVQVFIWHYLPTECPITGVMNCREERLNDLWLQELLPCANELVAWHESALDGTAWQRAKAERRRGREWGVYDDFLLNIEQNLGREKRPVVWVRIS
jgi:hypothetical protein